MIRFSDDTPKEKVFDEIRSYLTGAGLKIADHDGSRPWGGYFVIEESQVLEFIQVFFPHLNLKDFDGFDKLSPKILLVAPHKRLSWQFHHRRSEIWKVVGGRVAVAISDTDEQAEARLLPAGSVVELEKGKRHRLIGTDEWGVVAEIWKHTDPANPSDEDDIVRVQDDYGR